MKVLVTGASGVFGRDVVRRLALHGHEVVGLSRSRPDRLPAGMTDYHAADIRDAAAVADAMEGVDAVVHLTWTLAPNKDVSITRSIDLGGTRNVVEAMNRHGVKRLVFASSVMSYGCNADNPPRLSETSPQRPDPESAYSVHKVEAEQLIIASGLDALMIRAGTVIGRSVDNIIEQNFATPVLPGVRGYTNTMQFVHPEDVGRFFAQAVSERWSGPVNLAAPDTLPMREIASLLGRRYVELSRSTLERLVAGLWKSGLADLDPGSFRGLLWFPIVDTARLDELGFRCGWTSRECVEDFARASAGKTYILGRALPRRLGFGYHGAPSTGGPTGPGVHAAGPPGIGGEFDSLVDPVAPDYTSANTSEAFPGPMTPLSLELALACLYAAGAGVAEAMGFPPRITELLTDQPVGAFGHGIYANLSVVTALANVMPGSSGESKWEALQISGDVTVPQVTMTARDKARVGARAARVFGTFGREAARVDRQVRDVLRDSEALGRMTDEQLLARLSLTRDVTVDACVVAFNGSGFVASVSQTLAERGLPELATTRGDADLASSASLRSADAFAAQVRADASLRSDVEAAVAAGPNALDVLAQSRPDFAARVRADLAKHGHRGPRELELASPVFAQAPQRFLEVVLKSARGAGRASEPPPPPVAAHLRPIATWFRNLQHNREVGRDAVVRGAHAYRLVALEIGQRLVAQGLLDRRDDVFYLTHDQLLNVPADAKAIVARRRAERERLESIRLPSAFSGTWEPVDDTEQPLGPSDIVTGAGVSAGVARGPVRVLRPEHLDDLEPDEILVAEYTDAGWTPYFGLAAAVVTGSGGPMSHAAVVARECGIPCVAGVPDISRRLRTGQLVEVDGATGRVTVLGDAE